MRTIFTTLLYLALLNIATADSIIWRQEIGCDIDSICRPGAMAVDVAENKVIIMGTSERSDTKEINFWAWEIDPNGNVKQKKSLGIASEFNKFMARTIGIRANVNTKNSDIIGLNMLGDANGISLSVTGKNMQPRTVKLETGRNWSKGIFLYDLASCQNDDIILVGKDSNSNGIVIKTDLTGKVIWKKIFDLGQTEILSGISCEPDGNNFYVVGLSASMTGKMTFAGPATVCVLRYDSNGEITASTYVEGGVTPWPTSLPKVICPSSNTVLVAYDKSKNAKVTDLYIKTYTKRLEPLDEKLMMQSKEGDPPIFFDISAMFGNRFVFAGVTNFKDLRLYECEKDGTIIQTFEQNEAVGSVGIYVDYLAEKILVAFEKKPNISSIGSKVELIALKPYKAN